LGETFDIHGGGLDLTFPHHENEIAQSCCANDTEKLANIWMHAGFLTMRDEKMSKSLGNILLVHDLIEQGIQGEAIRLTLLSAQYRQPLSWTDNALNQSIKTLDKWYDAIPEDHISDTIDEEFLAALCDDMNTPLAISILHKIAREKPEDLVANASMLGLLTQTKEAWASLRQKSHNLVDTSEIELLIEQRNQARANKDFAKSDELRDQLASMGVIIKDGPDGTSWSFE
jgi:cysteinyl-tRNA synthetase